MSKPLNRVKLDESRAYRVIKVVVLYFVVVHISLEHLLISVFVRDVLPLKSVRAVRYHERSDPFLFARATLHDHARDFGGHTQVHLQPLRIGAMLGTPGTPVVQIKAGILFVTVGVPHVRVCARRRDLPVFDLTV